MSGTASSFLTALFEIARKTYSTPGDPELHEQIRHIMESARTTRNATVRAALTSVAGPAGTESNPNPVRNMVSGHVSRIGFGSSGGRHTRHHKSKRGHKKHRTTRRR
jgi:hypothetical protein